MTPPTPKVPPGFEFCLQHCELRRILLGNGGPGLVERVRTLEINQAKIFGAATLGSLFGGGIVSLLVYLVTNH